MCRGRPIGTFAVVKELRYWRCADCEATFLDRSQLPDEQAELERYEQHHNDPADPGYIEHLGRLVRPLLARLGPGRRGLDYGCGPGPEPVLAGLLERAGHTVRLYDPLYRPDLAALDLTYDFITCSETAEHFHHPAEEFERFERRLEPGGWLGVMTRFLDDDVLFDNWHYRRDPTHVVFYRPATFRKLTERFGWDCELLPPDVALMRRPSS